MMLYAGVVGAAFCCALSVIAIAWATRGQTEVDEPALPQVERVREEDLVRPTFDADGNPTWVAADEMVWHDIVHWPLPKALGSDRKRRQSA